MTIHPAIIELASIPDDPEIELSVQPGGSLPISIGEDIEIPFATPWFFFQPSTVPLFPEATEEDTGLLEGELPDEDFLGDFIQFLFSPLPIMEPLPPSPPANPPPLPPLLIPDPGIDPFDI